MLANFVYCAYWNGGHTFGPTGYYVVQVYGYANLVAGLNLSGDRSSEAARCACRSGTYASTTKAYKPAFHLPCASNGTLMWPHGLWGDCLRSGVLGINPRINYIQEQHIQDKPDRTHRINPNARCSASVGHRFSVRHTRAHSASQACSARANGLGGKRRALTAPLRKNQSALSTSK